MALQIKHLLLFRDPMTVLAPYSFCMSLFSQENILLDIASTTSPSDAPSVYALIQDIDAIMRDDAPQDPPPLDVQAAMWGLATLYWGCLTLVNRFDTRTHLPDMLQAAEPNGLLAEHHWSVDIGLRFLSDLVRRTSAAATEDPLTNTLLELGARWPHSSIGTNAAWRDDRIQVVLNNPCMRHLLFDRMHQRRDVFHSQQPLVNVDYQAHIALPRSVI
jgi:hypothetical protein